jgi:hypothetical protein
MLSLRSHFFFSKEMPGIFQQVGHKAFLLSFLTSETNFICSTDNLLALAPERTKLFSGSVVERCSVAVVSLVNFWKK